jgi:hypothetical protein
VTREVQQITSADARAASRLATVLTSTPGLRARLFAKPAKLGRQLPPRRYWDYGIDPRLLPWHLGEFLRQRHYKRARLGRQTLEEIAERIDRGDLSSTVNTDAVFEDFFEPIVRVSQRTFNAVFILSILAFLVGTALIGAGVYLAIYPPSKGDSTILGSVFGGSGAVSTLGSVYTMATQGITRAGSSHARLRVVLTGFATQLGQLRAIAEATPSTPAGKGPAPQPSPEEMLETAGAINKKIGEAMGEAVKLMPQDEQKKKTTNGQDQGEAQNGQDQGEGSSGKPDGQ